jgi:hypothetical protein
MTESEKFYYRNATSDDADEIFGLIRGRPRNPGVARSTGDQQAMRHIIVMCCDSDESRVSVDADGKLVGFVLAKPDRLERFLHENNALHLSYIGVSPLSANAEFLAR